MNENQEIAAASRARPPVRRGGEPSSVRPGSPSPAAAIASPSTGAVRLEVLSGTFTAAFEPFTQAPPPDEGALERAQRLVNGALGLVALPFELADTAIALADTPGPIAGPKFPAARLGSMHIAPPHAHMHPPSFVPPAPPIPLPSIGSVQLACCQSVFIGGMPAARAGDMGLALTCVSLAPVFEIMTGSSTVFIGGARAARMLDMTRVCNPIGMTKMGALGAIAGALGGALDAAVEVSGAMDADAAAEAASSAAEAQAAASAATGHAVAAATAASQVAADALAAVMSAMMGMDPGIPFGVGMIVDGSLTVLIGGVPMPSADTMFSEIGDAIAERRARRRAAHEAEASGHVGAPACVHR
jgi:uncharacterized Zn-binding protein involved in type VI secretion